MGMGRESKGWSLSGRVWPRFAGEGICPQGQQRQMLQIPAGRQGPGSGSLVDESASQVVRSSKL